MVDRNFCSTYWIKKEFPNVWHICSSWVQQRTYVKGKLKIERVLKNSLDERMVLGLNLFSFHHLVCLRTCRNTWNTIQTTALSESVGAQPRPKLVHVSTVLSTCDDAMKLSGLYWCGFYNVEGRLIFCFHSDTPIYITSHFNWICTLYSIVGFY